MSRPTIFEAAGGSPAFEALTVRFYEKVRADPLLSPVFASFTAERAKHVAIWLGEVFGGPPRYSEEHGGPRTVLERHRNLGSPDQKERWVHVSVDTAREREADTFFKDRRRNPSIASSGVRRVTQGVPILLCLPPRVPVRPQFLPRPTVQLRFISSEDP
jgi:truncated hemoglobin YjbI